MVAIAVSPARAQSVGSAAEAERIRSAYPGIYIHYPQKTWWAGAEQVFGRPMPASGPEGRSGAETPEDALIDWLDEYSNVFLGEGDAGQLDFAILATLPMLDTKLGHSRTVIRFSQRLADPRDPKRDLPIQGVHGRAMLSELPVAEGGGWAVHYVSVAALDVSETGLGLLTLAAEAARVIAATQSHAAAASEAMQWGEPILAVLAAGDSGENPREARVAWVVPGFDGTSPIDGFEVAVDSTSGMILAEWESGPLNFDPTVSGTVDGEVLLGSSPYETELDCNTFITDDDHPLQSYLVELLDSPGGTLIASTRTNTSGYYEFSHSITGSSRVRFTPEHKYFVLGQIDDTTASGIPGSTYMLEVDWSLIEGVEKTIPLDGVRNYSYEDVRGFGVAAENVIGDASVWTVIDASRLFYRARLQNSTHYLGLDDDDLMCIVNDEMIANEVGWGRGASYWRRTEAIGTTSPTFGRPTLIFSNEGPAFGLSGGDVPNRGHSTIASHEYGHFALHEAFGIDTSNNYAIHEAYADILSILLHDGTDIIGFAGRGCDGTPSTPQPIRDWLAIESAWSDARNCLHGGGFEYARAEHLVLIWREIDDQICLGSSSNCDSLSVTRQMFVDWSLIATAEPLSSRLCPVSAADRSARDATFYEVLTADDDNNTLADGTPNSVAICAAFAAYGLPVDDPEPDPCAESASACPADLDHDGQFTIFDLLLHEQWIAASDPRADLDQDGDINMFDRLYLLNQSLGCR